MFFCTVILTELSMFCVRLSHFIIKFEFEFEFYPTPIPAKIRGCSLWSRSVMLGSAERGKVRLISCKYYFPRIPSYMTTILQTDRQSDRQLGLAIPRYAMLRAVKKTESMVSQLLTASSLLSCYVVLQPTKYISDRIVVHAENKNSNA